MIDKKSGFSSLPLLPLPEQSVLFLLLWVPFYGLPGRNQTHGYHPMCPLQTAVQTQSTHQKPVLLWQKRMPASQENPVAKAKAKGRSRLCSQPKRLPKKLADAPPRLLDFMAKKSPGVHRLQSPTATGAQPAYPSPDCKDGRVNSKFFRSIGMLFHHPGTGGT